MTNPAIQHLKESLTQGKHWYIALLEAIGQWTEAEEVHHDRHYRYLIDGEAFDWLLLAQRLCEEVDGLVAEEEVAELLFWAKPPLELSREEFRNLIGSAKYRAYLNYFYGVTVEEALIAAVTEEVRKEQRCRCFKEVDPGDEGHIRIYGAPRRELLEQFRQERGYPRRRSMELEESKEFTYWLFKYRVKQCEKARVASDTKKGLAYLQSLGSRRIE